MRHDLYETPELENLGGGSGIWSHSVETLLGTMRIVHWKLTHGELTEISISDSFYLDHPWPTIKLAGHQKPVDYTRFYIEALLRLGGVPELVNGISGVKSCAFKNGEAAARAEMRRVLGFKGE